MKPARNYLTELYLDYINNYLTVEKFSEHNGITEYQGAALLAVAKDIFESDHPDA